MKKSTIVHSALLLAGITLALLFSEGIARMLVGPVPYIAPATPTQCIGLHGVAPNTTSTYENPETGTRLITYNELGLRGSLQKSSDNESVFIIGDSIVEALEVEENVRFTNELEKKLQQEKKRDIRIWNLGLAGSGTISQLCTLQRALSLATPKVVVLVFFENDLGDNIEWDFLQAQKQEDSKLSGEQHCEGRCSLSPLGRWGTFHRILREWSSLYRLTMGRLNPFIQSWLHPDTHFQKTAPLLMTPPGADLVRARGKSEELIEAMRGQAEATGARFVVANMPTLTSIAPQYWTRYADRFAPHGTLWDTDQNHSWLKEVCVRHSWQCLDLRESGLTEHDYFPTDQHLNENGHEKISQFLALELSRFLRGK